MNSSTYLLLCCAVLVGASPELNMLAQRETLTYESSFHVGSLTRYCVAAAFCHPTVVTIRFKRLQRMQWQGALYSFSQ